MPDAFKDGRPTVCITSRLSWKRAAGESTSNPRKPMPLGISNKSARHFWPPFAPFLEFRTRTKIPIMKKKDPGRNNPCPCGSGRKYKKCHGSPNYQNSRFVLTPALEEKIKLQIERQKAKELIRQNQQGLGRPVISVQFQGYRFIAVRERLYWSKNWKTFHDFLGDYIKDILGSDWGNSELKKPSEERHQILQWYQLVCDYQKKMTSIEGGIYSAPITGAVQAYLGLAYNLFLISHNVALQSKLISRLKNKSQFQGALYETFVAAVFIKAGFELEFEDENDPTTSHCEFTATFIETKRKFSVEAKSRIHGRERIDIFNQLRGALEKSAKHERIVLIDLNMADGASEDVCKAHLLNARDQLREKEANLNVKRKPAPPAYVIFTNLSYLYNLESTRFVTSALAEGFKINDFKVDAAFSSLREAITSRKKHREIIFLMDSFRTHSSIPSTFDGELPNISDDLKNHRLLIGNWYILPDANGKEVRCKLVDAIVSVEQKLAVCFYQLENGSTSIGRKELTDEELALYERHSDTFFGVFRRQSKGINTPMEFYDFIWMSYKDTPNSKLLEFISKFQNVEQLKNCSHEDLLITYCEHLIPYVFQK